MNYLISESIQEVPNGRVVFLLKDKGCDIHLYGMTRSIFAQIRLHNFTVTNSSRDPYVTRVFILCMHFHGSVQSLSYIYYHDTMWR